MHAFRSLLKAPGFASVAVLSLALGICVSTTIFSVVNPLLFRPLPFEDPSTLIYLNEANPKQGYERMSVSYADYVHWKNENRTLSSVEIWSTTGMSVTGIEQAERVVACRISPTLFDTLGLPPLRGRNFRPEEDKPGSAPVIILGHALWARLFNSSDDALGRTLTLNGTAHTIVGVMRPRVRFPYDADLWIPMVVNEPEKTHGNFNSIAAARLKPGVTLAQATADLATVQAHIAQESPQTNAEISVVPCPMMDGFADAELRTMGWLMLGASAFVLAVACANVASLFLTRSVGKRKEFAVRAALGSGRWRIVRQLLGESLVLGCAGGALGLLLSLWGVDVVLRLVPVEIPYWLDFSFDWRVFAFAAGASLFTSVVFGLAPAWHVARIDVVAGLNETSRGSSGSRPQSRLRRTFVVAEVATASLLLCGTGLMLRSLLKLQRVDPGFTASRLSTFGIELSTAFKDNTAGRTAFIGMLVDRLRSVPGVTAAAGGTPLPLSGGNTGQVFTVEGQPPPASGLRPVGNLRIVTPGYFEAMQIPLHSGRDFSPSDTATSGKVLILDQALARQYFPDSNPLGQRIRWDPNDPASSREIVGVVGDVKHSSLDGSSRAGFYIPYAQNPRSGLGIVVRTKAESPAGLLTSVQQAVRALNPNVPIHHAQPMEQMIQETYWIRRYLARLLLGFAVLALGLASLGIASVVAYSVTVRSQEIGIRMALGAVPADVVRLMLRDGMRLVAYGLALGLAGSVMLAGVLRSQLFGVGIIDPTSLVGCALAFLLVGLLACWLPARRAARVNPIEALRAE